MEKVKILNLMDNRKNYDFIENKENEMIFINNKSMYELSIKYDPKHEVYSFNEYELGFAKINIETPEKLVEEIMKVIIL